MGPFLIASACLVAGIQKPPPDNLLYPDVPDNHVAYAILHELKADGLLPEWDDLVRGNRPLTRGQIGRFLAHAAMNLQQFVEDHRQVTGPPGPTLKYSDAMTTFSGKQLTYLVALTPRLRK